MCRYTVNILFPKIETALGRCHALAAKRNLLLMTGSFALGIILFFSFSVLIELVDCLMPQRANDSDIELYSDDNSNSLDSSLIDEISKMGGVKQIFGRRSSFDVPAKIYDTGHSEDKVDLISFDQFDLDCLTEDKQLTKDSDISKVYGDSSYVLSVYDKENSLEIGDTIRLDDEELEVAGLLKYNIFSSDGSSDGEITLITSGETFARLTNETGYSLLSIQLTKTATDRDAEAIRTFVGDKGKFRDMRDQSTAGTYTAFVVLVYTFAALIMLVALLNIVNSISMSVSARIKQYGVMRAVGMSERQLTRMITAEAATYVFAGCLTGCAASLPLSKLMYDKLITAHFPYSTWSIPAQPLLIVLLFSAAATTAAIYAPAKRIRNMTIVETIFLYSQR